MPLFQRPADSHPRRLRLGWLLRQYNLLSRAQLASALRYQRQHKLRLGEALLRLGLIDPRTLNRMLRRQRWLTPCATCLLLCSPFSAAWAADEAESGFSQDWLDSSRWSHVAQEHITQQTAVGDVLTLVAAYGWQWYDGEQQAGDVSISLKQPEQDGLSLQLSMRF